jgi:hypothetical protein
MARNCPNQHSPAELRLAEARTVALACRQLVSLLAFHHPGVLPATAAVREHALAHVGSGRSLNARQGLRIAVISLTGVYVERFWPVGARLVASGVDIGGATISLIWMLGDGALIADDLKTGIAASPQHPRTVLRAHHQAALAGQLLGASFLGVRGALLRRAVDSFFAASRPQTDERRVPIVRGHRPSVTIGV